jgi:hypothetical protein
MRAGRTAPVAGGRIPGHQPLTPIGVRWADGIAPTEQGFAGARWEGVQARRLPPDLPPLGQIRFGFTKSGRTENTSPIPADNLNFEVRHTLCGAAYSIANYPSLQILHCCPSLGIGKWGIWKRRVTLISLFARR